MITSKIPVLWYRKMIHALIKQRRVLIVMFMCQFLASLERLIDLFRAATPNLVNVLKMMVDGRQHLYLNQSGPFFILEDGPTYADFLAYDTLDNLLQHRANALDAHDRLKVIYSTIPICRSLIFTITGF